jgi:hypothetical protein
LRIARPIAVAPSDDPMAQGALGRHYVASAHDPRWSVQ